jgi:hypothetical protein
MCRFVLVCVEGLRVVLWIGDVMDGGVDGKVNEERDYSAPT